MPNCRPEIDVLGPAPAPGRAVPVVAPPLALPAGWRLVTPEKLVSGKALPATAVMGRKVLFCKDDEGWVCRNEVRVSRACGQGLLSV